MIKTEKAEIQPDLPPEIIEIILVYTHRIDVAMELDRLHIIRKIVPKNIRRSFRKRVS